MQDLGDLINLINLLTSQAVELTRVMVFHYLKVPYLHNSYHHGPDLK